MFKNQKYIKETIDDPQEILNKIINWLEKQTGKKYNKSISFENLKDMDLFFKTSFFKYPPTVLQDLKIEFI